MIAYEVRCMLPAMEMAIEVTPKAEDKSIPSYLQKYAVVFSEKVSQQIPTLWPYDMTIQLKDNFIPCMAKVFLLTNGEDMELKQFLDENMNQGYIKPSTSEMALAFFFIKKKMVN